MRKETRKYFFSVEGKTEKWYLEWLQRRGALVHRRHYLEHLNRAYDEGFESLDEYKQEDGFRRVLAKLTLGDVRQAIRRAEAITQKSQADGCVLQQYKGYEYYRENPSLSVWRSIRQILDDCGLLEACSSDSTPTD